MHPDDKPVAEREFEQFLDGFWYHAAPNAVEINPWGPRIRANSKLVQLETARACGFTVSPTLMSNDPDRIQAFLAEQGIENCIFKTFRPAGWREPDGRGFGISTTRLKPGDCGDPAGLRLSPGIYQRYVEKARELRVTVMGERAYAAHIDASHVALAQTDWRVARGDVRVSPEALPADVEDKIRRLMKALNLKFGGIDLILSPDGEYHFLEVNEMGQFLWMERKNPELPLLRHFARFVCDELGVAPDWSDISYEECRGSAEYRDVLAEIRAKLAASTAS